MSAARHRIAIAVAALLALPATAAQARATNGTISRTAGSTPGFAGDGGPATQALIDTPSDVAFLPDGSYVIADTANNRVRRVFADGRIFTDAGTGDAGFCCDGGPATDANINRPGGVTAMPDGGYLIADTGNDVIRRVFPGGRIETVAGNNGELRRPSDTAVLPDGTFLIADTGNDVIRRVAADGSISTIAGTGARGFAGDGGPATAAQLSQPRDIAVAGDAILVADTGNDRIRRIAPDGTITTVAGTQAGLSGDGDPAATAKLNAPSSVAPLPHGGFIFADTANHRIRRVTPLGAIFTVAGTDAGDAGDGGLAKNARLNTPAAITNAPGGGFAIADTGNAQIRRVSDIGAVPDAVLGRSIGVAPASGDVTVKPLGMPGYLPLQEEDLVPVQSQVDATKGHIAVTVARDASGTQISAELFDSPFTVQQGNDAQPYTNFRLPPLSCGTATRAVSEKKRKKRRRSLWVKESGGRWRSSTGSTSASAVGTFWNTQLLCAGTRISVFEGIVRVRDKVRRRNRLVLAGQSYLVRTSGARRGQ